MPPRETRRDRRARERLELKQRKPGRRSVAGVLSSVASRTASFLKAEAVPRLSPRELSRLSRRQLLVRGAAGITEISLASLAARWASKRIPFWVGSEKPYNLTLGFGLHVTPEHAQAIAGELKKAKRAGRPYHVAFFESSEVLEKNYDKVVRVWNTSLANIRKAYLKLRAHGVPEAEAKARATTSYCNYLRDQGVNFPEWTAERDFHLAMHGVKILPLESYSDSEKKRINRLLDRAEPIGRSTEKLFSENAPLSEIAKGVLRVNQFYDQVALVREPRMQEFLRGRVFDRAVRLFPELRSLGQLRGLAYLGDNHLGVYATYANAERNVQVKEVFTHFPPISIGRHKVRLLEAGQKLTVERAERIARLEVLEHYLDKLIELLANAGKKDLASRLFTRATALSGKDFERLSEATNDIRSSWDRSVEMANLLLGEKLLELRYSK